MILWIDLEHRVSRKSRHIPSLMMLIGSLSSSSLLLSCRTTLRLRNCCKWMKILSWERRFNSKLVKNSTLKSLNSKISFVLISSEKRLSSKPKRPDQWKTEHWKDYEASKISLLKKKINLINKNILGFWVIICSLLNKGKRWGLLPSWSKDSNWWNNKHYEKGCFSYWIHSVK